MKLKFSATRIPRYRGSSLRKVAYCFSLLLWHAHLFAQHPFTVDIQQANVDLPSIIVYLDVLGPGKKSVNSVNAKEARAAIGTQWIPFESLRPFEGTGEGVAYVALVDVSRSIGKVKFNDARNGLRAFIANMTSSDRMALITLGDEPVTIQEFTSDQSLLLKKLDELAPVESRTALYAGLVDALQKLSGPLELPGRRAVLVLSDGQDDDDLSGKSDEDVKNAIKATHIPIFAIGISEEPPTPNADAFLTILAGFAASSHGAYLRLRQSAPAVAYESIRHAVRRVFVGKLNCDSCPHDGQDHALKVVLQNSASAVAEVTLFPPKPPPPAVVLAHSPKPARKPLFANSILWIVVFFAAGMALAAWLFYTVRSRPRQQPTASALVDRTPNWQLTLTYVGGKHEDLTVPFIDELLIGADRSCNLTLTDPSINDRHCRIVAKSGHFYIRSLNSPHDTTVDGKPTVSELKIDRRSEIRLGDLLFHVNIENLQ